MVVENLVAALSRARRVAILASADVFEVALELQKSMEGRGCQVVAGFEGATAGSQSEIRCSSQDGNVLDAVLILGASPNTTTWTEPGLLQAAASVAFSAIADKAPLFVLGSGEDLIINDSCPPQLPGGPRTISWIANAIRQQPASDRESLAAAAEERWQNAVVAIGEEADEKMSHFLKLYPELLAARDDHGCTLLHKVAAMGSAKMLLLLLQTGASWRQENKKRYTAGDVAFSAGHQAVFDALVIHACAQQRAEGSDTDEPSAKKRRHGHDAYLRQELRYADERLLDADGRGIMMGWEAPLMSKHAEFLMPKVGADVDVLNIGFGLGLVDTEIQRRRPKSHTIVEAHPDVLAEMQKQGWQKKSGVIMHYGRWQDIAAKLPSCAYDAIFFDTWQETYVELRDFFELLPRLLRPNGYFSFFNGLAPFSIFHHAVFCRMAQEDLHQLGLNCDFFPVKLGSLAGAWQGIAERYWHFELYYLPVARMPQDEKRPVEQKFDQGDDMAWRRWPAIPVRTDDSIGPSPCGDPGIVHDT